MCDLCCEVSVYVINLDIKLSSTSSFWIQVDVTIVKLVIPVNTAACDNDNEVTPQPVLNTERHHVLFLFNRVTCPCITRKETSEPVVFMESQLWYIHWDIAVVYHEYFSVSYIHVQTFFCSEVVKFSRPKKKKKNHNNTFTGYLVKKRYIKLLKEAL